MEISALCGLVTVLLKFFFLAQRNPPEQSVLVKKWKWLCVLSCTPQKNIVTYFTFTVIFCHQPPEQPPNSTVFPRVCVCVSLIEQGPAGSGGSSIKCKLSCLPQHLSQHWQDRQMPNLLSKQISLTMQPLSSEITNVTSDLAI